MAIETIYIGNEIANTDTLRDGFDKVNSNTNDLDVNKVPYSGARANVDLGENQIKVGQLELDQTPSNSGGVGILRWNNTDGTADLGLKGGNVTLQVGQEQVLRVVNKAAVDLLEANYQAVKIIGATGQRISVNLAQGDTDLNSATTIGIVTETIAKNQEGFITTSGAINEINTTGSLQGETWADGDVLYLSPTIAGKITNIKPVAPQHLIILGYVEYAHNNHGKIFVKVDNGYELDELHNVLIATPTNDQVLQFESATSLWKNKTISSGLTIGSTAIASGTDGRVLFQSAGVLQQSANFFWDNTNSRLGIGNSSPTARLHISAQGALSTDIAIRVRNSANTADLFSVLGNGVTNVSTLTASNQINISQPAGLYYPTIAFTANGSQSCGTIEGYNSGLYIRNTAYLNLNSPSVYVGGYGTGVASAAFTITSTTKGFMPPRMTTTEKNAIATPAAGLVVYDTTLGKLCLRGAAAWETITSI
jgi:hypothetical protein